MQVEVDGQSRDVIQQDGGFRQPVLQEQAVDDCHEELRQLAGRPLRPHLTSRLRTFHDPFNGRIQWVPGAEDLGELVDVRFVYVLSTLLLLAAAAVGFTTRIGD